MVTSYGELMPSLIIHHALYRYPLVGLPPQDRLFVLIYLLCTLDQFPDWSNSLPVNPLVERNFIQSRPS